MALFCKEVLKQWIEGGHPVDMRMAPLCSHFGSTYFLSVDVRWSSPRLWSKHEKSSSNLKVIGQSHQGQVAIRKVGHISRSPRSRSWVKGSSIVKVKLSEGQSCKMEFPPPFPRGRFDTGVFSFTVLTKSKWTPWKMRITLFSAGARHLIFLWIT